MIAGGSDAATRFGGQLENWLDSFIKEAFYFMRLDLPGFFVQRKYIFTTFDILYLN
ncbi:hypothetical protein GW879_00235 [Candidatus Kaiserbacteria bacterium]|nr:hypothetical protein [Candidatus Kaiserbacteria bacterium]